MDSQDFRRKFAGGILAGIEDKVCDARHAFARFLFAGRYGCRHQGSGAVRGDGCRNDFQRLARAFHHVVPAGPVNVDIDKARHNGSSAGVDFARSPRQIDFPSLPDGGNLAPLNDDDGIGDFFEWSEGSVGVDDNRLHKDGIILLETRRNWESRCSGDVSGPRTSWWIRVHSGQPLSTGRVLVSVRAGGATLSGGIGAR